MEDRSLLQKIRKIYQVEDVLDETEKKKVAALIRNIFRYMDKHAKDIMTHRTDIVYIDAKVKLEDALIFMLEENYSRFPIVKVDIDEIIGFLHVKEAMKCYLNKDLRELPLIKLKEFIRPVAFIPETKSIDKLFKEMQANKNHIAVVISEYGQTSGIVTMEDILEEIVGNIMDEHDEEEESIIPLTDGGYLAHGISELEDLEDLLCIKFNKEDYGTLNGFMIEQLDCIPSEDEPVEPVEYEGYRFTVLEVENNRIEHVKIEKLKN